jgi:hypothetical protein
LKTIIKSLLFISLIYSIVYYLVIQDYLIEKVKERYSILFEHASEIEPNDYYMDGEDSYAPIYTESDQAMLDEMGRYISQGTEPFHTIWNISLFLSFLFFAKYGKEFVQNPFYLRFLFALYLSLAVFGLIHNFTQFRFIIFIMILYFLFKQLKRNKIAEFNISYILVYIGISILFNPFIQFHFGKDIWLFIDLFTIVIVLIEPFLFKTYFNKESNVESAET